MTASISTSRTARTVVLIHELFLTHASFRKGQSFGNATAGASLSTSARA